MNNDPFKKMDLNFDPTVEAKVDTHKEQVSPNAEVNRQTVIQEQVAMRTEADALAKRQQEEKAAQVERLAANEYAMKQEQAILSQAQSNEPKELDKTLEFIVQEDDIDTNVDEKTAAKKLEKEAYKHRRYSFYWIGICVLSIIFGIGAIFSFANNIMDFIGEVTAEDVSIWGSTREFFAVFFDSFEALLFTFFILFSAKKYRDNHKPWNQWWIDTEPIRIAKALKVEMEVNSKNRTRINSLGVPFTPVIYSGTTNKEKLEHFKEENKILSGLVKNEEQRRKAAAKAAKK